MQAYQDFLPIHFFVGTVVQIRIQWRPVELRLKLSSKHKGSINILNSMSSVEQHNIVFI